VRQGCVISPLLFAVYVDDVINELCKADLGCRIGSFYKGCLVYADDLVLLSVSVS